MTTLNSYDVACEYISIFMGSHPDHKGDRVYNAETYLFRLAYDMPEEAAILAVDFIENSEEFSDLLGCSPFRMRIAGRYIQGVLSRRPSNLGVSV
jgi:hypothetical protein